MNSTLAIIASLAFVFSGTCVGASFFEELRQRAGALAEKPYQSSSVPVSPIPSLSYEEHRAIRFRPEKALWLDQKLPFAVEFFHPGYVHERTVTIHELDSSFVSHPIEFSSTLFDYGTNRVLNTNGGFAGFRLVNLRSNGGEFAVFLGASYFRMIGEKQSYGASARGLALNTAQEGGEEFPSFKEFWIQRPGKSDQSVTVYALLDSPSVAGAFHFVIRPGNDTVTTITALLFPRTNVTKFGLAPLTSMFLHGENGRPPFQDFRPEVHDSDGLLLHSGRGEWIWHPLETGKMMRVNAFADENPKGFGLMQRDRDFEHYQDGVAHFQDRPSVWVKPIGNWGRGAIELVQLTTDREFQDNIVAFWVPLKAPQRGESLDLSYELHWSLSHPSPAKLGEVKATRIGRVFVEPPQGPPNLRFVVDFGGTALEQLPANTQPSVAIRYGDNVKFVADSLYNVEKTKDWRLVIEIKDPGKAVDLSAFLKLGDKPITETWTFTWQP